MKLLRDLWLLVKSYPLAVRIVKELNDIEHAGVVKFQIGFQKMKTALVKEKSYVHDEITGSVVYLSLAIAAWRHSK